MNTPLLALQKKEIQGFILQHEKDDLQKLLLKHNDVFGIPTRYIANQISGRRKAHHKLPTFYKTSGIIYPPSVNLEQSSSEATARFKLETLRSLFQKPPVVADLTGGLGVDTYYFSKYARQIHYVEPDVDLMALANHNLDALGASQVIYHNQSAEDFLANSREKIDLIYLDPSRRKGDKKILRLKDCEPNVVDLQSEYLHNAIHILVKASPLLDITQGCKELSGVAQVTVLAVENECKELLFHIQTDYPGTPRLRAVNLDANGKIESSISIDFGDEKKSIVSLSKLQSYLFEPNAAILKAGAFKWIGQTYGLSKLALHTHLYTSDKIHDNFPGRIFEIKNVVKLDKTLLKLFPKGYANILTRNYPLTVEQIKKKTGLKEGGEQYLICTQDQNERLAVIARRLK